MIDEYIVKKLLPWIAWGTGIYWFLGNSNKVRITLVYSWFLTVPILIGYSIYKYQRGIK